MFGESGIVTRLHSRSSSVNLPLYAVLLEQLGTERRDS